MIAKKHLKLTGSSDISWKDSIVQTIQEASKTIDYISSVKILDQSAEIDGNKIVKYYTTIDLTFDIDPRGWFLWNKLILIPNIKNM